MLPTNNLSIFIKNNDSELKRIIYKICSNLNCLNSVEDFIQDIYVKLLTTDIIQSYNSDNCKISTYLYSIIKNHILFKLVTHKYPNDKCRNVDIDWDKDLSDKINFISIVPNEHKNTLLHNDLFDNIDGLKADLHDFKEKILKSHHNKKFNFNKNKKIYSDGCTLSEVFEYLYEGYTCKEIAEIYGVSITSICSIKHKLAEIMASNF